MQCISYWKPRFPLKSHFRLDLCPKCNCCKWTSCICSKTIICSLLLLHPVSSFLVYISSQTIICHLPISNVHRICLDRKYSEDMKRAFNQKIKAEKNSIIIFFLFLLAFQVCQQSGNKPDRRKRIRKERERKSCFYTFYLITPYDAMRPNKELQISLLQLSVPLLIVLFFNRRQASNRQRK